MEIKAAGRSKLTLYIGIGLVLGIVAGFLLNTYYVGNENQHIANADLQQKSLHDKMKSFETAKDTVTYQKFAAQKKELAALKKVAEKKMRLASSGTTAGVDANDKPKTSTGAQALQGSR